MICVCPRVKSAEPCVRGDDADLAVDRADLVRAAPVRAPLLDRDLLADEVLVDRLGRPLDELLRQRVLDQRALAVDRRRADRERQLDRLDDPLEEQVALRRLAAPSSPARPRSARAGRPRTARGPAPSTASSRCSLEEQRSGWSAPAAGGRCRPRSSPSSDRRRELGLTSSSTIAPASRRPSLPGSARGSRAPCSRSSSARQLGVEPLRLADLRARAPPAPRRACRSRRARARSASSSVSSGISLGAGLDHRQRRPSCRRRSGRARCPPRSPAASG